MNINQNVNHNVNQNNNQPEYIPQSQSGLGFIPNFFMNIRVQLNNQRGVSSTNESWNGTVTYYLNLIGRANFPQQAFDAVTKNFPTLQNLFIQVRAVAEIVRNGSAISVPVPLDVKIENNNNQPHKINILPKSDQIVALPVLNQLPEIKTDLKQESPINQDTHLNQDTQLNQDTHLNQPVQENTIPIPPPLPPKKQIANEAKKAELVAAEKIVPSTSPKEAKPTTNMADVFAQIRQGATLKKAEQQPISNLEKSDFKKQMEARRKQLESDEMDEMEEIQNQNHTPIAEVKEIDKPSIPVEPPKNERNWSGLLEQIRGGIHLRKAAVSEPKVKEGNLTSALENTALFKRVAELSDQ